MSSSAKISWAMELDGKPIHINNVPRGSSYDCVCFECKEKLVAKKGEKNIWHFAHSKDSSCSTTPESALHFAAKHILLNEIINSKSYKQSFYSTKYVVSSVFFEYKIYHIKL